MDGLGDVTELAKERLRHLEARLRRDIPDIELGPDIKLGLQTGAEDPSRKYTWLPEEIIRMNGVLRERAPHRLGDFNRYVLLRAIMAFAPDRGRYRLPPSVVSLYPREFERMSRQIDTFDDAFFDLANDQFLKDLAIATHRLIPVGAEFAEGGAGIPRRLAFAAGLKQTLAFLWLVLFRCRGVRPFFALHAHTLSLDDFNEKGWLATYHRLAELLAMNPAMKGWLSASWFLDPALETISPHLVHLRKVPTDNGAILLLVGREEGESTSGALTKSATRRRLFAEGRYLPVTYMRIWPRKAMIRWSRHHGGA